MWFGKQTRMIGSSEQYSSVATSAASTDDDGGGRGDDHNDDLLGQQQQRRYHPKLRPSSYLLKSCLGIVGLMTSIFFIILSIFFARHCAQLLANEMKDTVYWSPNLAGLLAAIGLVSQVIICTIPFQICIQRPILKRYDASATLTAYALSKQAKRVSRRNTIYNAILVYFPTTTVTTSSSSNQSSSSSGTAGSSIGADTSLVAYAKKFDITKLQFQSQTQFSVRALPDYPTSAIFESKYQEMIQWNSARNLKMYALACISPIMWVVSIKYTIDMQQYNRRDYDFWLSSGLPLLFMLSCICSFSMGYWSILNVNDRMLFGGATRIHDVSRIPEFIRSQAGIILPQEEGVIVAEDDGLFRDNAQEIIPVVPATILPNNDDQGNTTTTTTTATTQPPKASASMVLEMV